MFPCVIETLVKVWPADSCSYTLISRSPKLPLVFLELYGNTGNVFYFLDIKWVVECEIWDT